MRWSEEMFLCVRDENGTDSFGSGVGSAIKWPHQTVYQTNETDGNGRFPRGRRCWPRTVKATVESRRSSSGPRMGGHERSVSIFHRLVGSMTITMIIDDDDDFYPLRQPPIPTSPIPSLITIDMQMISIDQWIPHCVHMLIHFIVRTHEEMR